MKGNSSRISAGLVIFLLQFFVLFNIKFFSSDPTTAFVNAVAYISLQASIFALPDLRNALFGVSIWKWLLKASISFGVTFILLFIVGLVMNTNIAGIFSIHTVGSLLFISVYVAVVEQIFAKFMESYVGVFGSAFTLGMFHWLVKGGHILRVGVIIILFVVWLHADKKFGTSNTLEVSVGSHAAYDVFISGVQKVIMF